MTEDDVVVVEPQRLHKSDLDRIYELVMAGGAVDPAALRHRIEGAHLLAFLKLDSTIVSAGAIKNRKRLFKAVLIA